ncbi:MAG: tyrosine--tRNA ligase [Clostridiales Family XIII bacterium]|jgi:tyrosyl-tRNA synthetase|nr:tyrosine--tRNA ligase [Clostridiales Family XIII bacterium]
MTEKLSGNVFDVLKERGFIKQTTNDEEVRRLLGTESVRFYIGFDATADSLHVGHFMQIMTFMWMQKYGHRPIVLIGGGTTMVGDPSGRQDMRQIMTPEMITENGKKFVSLFERFIDFAGPGEDDAPGKAILLNNADWLLPLNYIEFLRDYGKYFSVNNMLRMECYKSRLEQGLTFLEFNYLLMQSYDFLEMYRRVGCTMQFGGDDQWSNILGGTDLIRRADGGQAYGMTFTLLTTSEGIKMGKTQAGALWLDASKTSTYDFFQYWRNVEDADVKNCLALLTFLPMEEVNRLGDLKDSAINEAKEVLAFEVTKLVHGEEEAIKARDASRALFADGGSLDDIPTSDIDGDRLKEGIGVVELIKEIGLVASNSEGFRTIEQGGLTIDDVKITDAKLVLNEDDFASGSILIRKGKKTFHRVQLV